MKQTNQDVSPSVSGWMFRGRVTELSDTHPDGSPYQVGDVVIMQNDKLIDELYVFGGEWQEIRTTVPDISAMSALVELIRNDRFVFLDQESRISMIVAVFEELQAVADYYSVYNWKEDVPGV